MMHIIFLPLLVNFKAAGYYSWGSTGLVWLYRELYRVSRIDAYDIVEPLILLQVWAWDRFSSIAPRRLLQLPIDPIMDLVGGDALPAGPLAMRYIIVCAIIIFKLQYFVFEVHLYVPLLFHYVGEEMLLR